MQLNLAFPEPVGSAMHTTAESTPPMAWEQIDAAARLAALAMLATLIARMLTASPASCPGHATSAMEASDE